MCLKYEFCVIILNYSKTAVFKVLDEGKVCILDIDMQGAQQVKETDLDPLMVFIQPPSLEVLETRLRSRGTETEESLKQRLDAAKIEMDYGELSHFRV